MPVADLLDSLVAPGDRIVAIGVDTASVGDSRRSLDAFGDAYVRRVCSGAEAAALPAGPCARARTLARLWAAKEAATKTLGPATGDSWPWPSVEIDLTTGAVRLTGRAAQLARSAGIGRVRITCAHGRGEAATHSCATREERVTMLALALDGASRATGPAHTTYREGVR